MVTRPAGWLLGREKKKPSLPLLSTKSNDFQVQVNFYHVEMFSSNWASTTNVSSDFPMMSHCTSMSTNICRSSSPKISTGRHILLGEKYDILVQVELNVLKEIDNKSLK